MNHILYKAIIIFLLASSHVVFADQRDFSSQPVFSRTYDPARDAYADGRAALALAQETNRRVIIEVGGEWCGFCHKLDAFLQQETELAQRFFDAFVLLKVNVSEENPNDEFLSAFSRIDGYPHMFITEPNGRVLHSQDTGLLWGKKNYSVTKFDAFIKQWKLPVK